MFRFILFCLLMAGHSTTIAQQRSIQPLQINELFPDTVLGKVLNFSQPYIRTSDLKGKLVILDFWDIHCLSCIRAMPKMEELQNQFEPKIQLILVTHNTKTEIDNLFLKLKKSPPKVLMIYDDVLLNRLFPHVTVPHHVWVNRERKVQFITDGLNTTAENISALLKGEEKHFTLKQEATDYDPGQPLLSEGGGRALQYVKSYSCIMGRLDIFRSSRHSVVYDSAKGTIGLKVINKPVLFLFKLAFGGVFDGGEYDLDSRVIVETKFRDMIVRPKSRSDWSDWESKNIMCYESVLPVERKNNLYITMQQDMNRYLPYSAQVEKRMVPCLVLYKLRTENELYAHGGEKSFIKQEKNNAGLTISNKPLSSLVRSLTYTYATKFPVVDETNETGNINLILSTDLTNLESVRSQLHRYGLDLIKSDREINMLVFKDK